MLHEPYDCRWSCWYHRPLNDAQIALLMGIITFVCLGVIIVVDRTVGR